MAIRTTARYIYRNNLQLEYDTVKIDFIHV